MSAPIIRATANGWEVVSNGAVITTKASYSAALIAATPNGYANRTA